MQAPTQRQLVVLQFIQDYRARHQRPPTLQDIAVRFGFNVNAARGHIEALQRKGLVEREPHKARAMRVVG